MLSDLESWRRKLDQVAVEDTFHFEPHFGWKGRIERLGSTSHNRPAAGPERTGE